MKITVSESKFLSEFKACRPDTFSFEALEALYEYLTQYEEDSGYELELDVIAICCDYTEYDDIFELIAQHPDDFEEAVENSDLVLDGDEEDPRENVEIQDLFLEKLADETTVLWLTNGGYVVQDI